jgi:hypothetical protein
VDKDEQLNQREIANAIREANPAQFPDFTKVNEELKAKAKANIAHVPKKQGPWIICTSCANPHTLQWIGPTKKLMGIDENGGYILEDITF